MAKGGSRTISRKASLLKFMARINDFSVHLTQYPTTHKNEDYTQQLRNKGLNDLAILDVVLVTSYFNFVNRLVLALGVQLEEHKGEGFKY